MRHIGNFGARPKRNTSTGNIVAVEPEEISSQVLSNVATAAVAFMAGRSSESPRLCDVVPTDRRAWSAMSARASFDADCQGPTGRSPGSRNRR